MKASSTAANLYAALAADVLEDEELLAEAPQPPAHLPPTPQSTQVITTHTVPVQNNTGSPQGNIIYIVMQKSVVNNFENSRLNQFCSIQ